MLRLKVVKHQGLLAVILLFVGTFLLLFFTWPRHKLLSPLASYTPDLSHKLASRLDSEFSLDFSKSQALPALKPIPHYLVFNLDSAQVYAAKAAEEKISPGSFTKLITAQVALDLGFPEQLLTASKTSTDKVPTILELIPGEQLTLVELLRGAIATSANDAAATLAEGVSVQNGLVLADFIKLVNQKATLLKLNNSYFANPDGLDDPSQFTTLVDTAKLTVSTVKNYPEILAAAVTDRLDIPETPYHRRHYLPNWNGLLKTYPGVFGLKIAYTENAGHGTIVLAERKGIRLAALVSGADSDLERDMAAAALLDFGFIAEKVPPANVSRYTIKKRYQDWANLARQIRNEQTPK